MLQSTYSPPPDMAPMESETAMDVSGKFQAEQPLTHKKTKYEWIFDGLYELCEWIWMLYVIIIAALCLWELSQSTAVFKNPISTSPFAGYTAWVILNAFALAVALAWSLYACMIGSRNAAANNYARVSNSKDVQLPHDPSRITIMWSVVVLFVWAVALALACQVFNQQGTVADATQASWFVSTIWTTFVACVITSLDWVCGKSRTVFDWILRGCNSSCYDC